MSWSRFLMVRLIERRKHILARIERQILVRSFGASEWVLTFFQELSTSGFVLKCVVCYSAPSGLPDVECV